MVTLSIWVKYPVLAKQFTPQTQSFYDVETSPLIATGQTLCSDPLQPRVLMVGVSEVTTLPICPSGTRISSRSGGYQNNVDLLFDIHQGGFDLKMFADFEATFAASPQTVRAERNLYNSIMAQRLCPTVATYGADSLHLEFPNVAPCAAASGYLSFPFVRIAGTLPTIFSHPTLGGVFSGGKTNLNSFGAELLYGTTSQRETQRLFGDGISRDPATCRDNWSQQVGSNGQTLTSTGALGDFIGTGPTLEFIRLSSNPVVNDSAVIMGRQIVQTIKREMSFILDVNASAFSDIEGHLSFVRPFPFPLMRDFEIDSTSIPDDHDHKTYETAIRQLNMIFSSPPIQVLQNALPTGDNVEVLYDLSSLTTIDWHNAQIWANIVDRLMLQANPGRGTRILSLTIYPSAIFNNRVCGGVCTYPTVPNSTTPFFRDFNISGASTFVSIATTEKQSTSGVKTPYSSVTTTFVVPSLKTYDCSDRDTCLIDMAGVFRSGLVDSIRHTPKYQDIQTCQTDMQLMQSASFSNEAFAFPSLAGGADILNLQLYDTSTGCSPLKKTGMTSSHPSVSTVGSWDAFSSSFMQSQLLRIFPELNSRFYRYAEALLTSETTVAMASRTSLFAAARAFDQTLPPHGLFDSGTIKDPIFTCERSKDVRDIVSFKVAQFANATIVSSATFEDLDASRNFTACRYVKSAATTNGPNCQVSFTFDGEPVLVDLGQPCPTLSSIQRFYPGVGYETDPNNPLYPVIDICGLLSDQAGVQCLLDAPIHQYNVECTTSPVMTLYYSIGLPLSIGSGLFTKKMIPVGVMPAKSSRDHTCSDLICNFDVSYSLTHASETSTLLVPKGRSLLDVLETTSSVHWVRDSEAFPSSGTTGGQTVCHYDVDEAWISVSFDSWIAFSPLMNDYLTCVHRVSPDIYSGVWWLSMCSTLIIILWAAAVITFLLATTLKLFKICRMTYHCCVCCANRTPNCLPCRRTIVVGVLASSVIKSEAQCSSSPLMTGSVSNCVTDWNADPPIQTCDMGGSAIFIMANHETACITATGIGINVTILSSSTEVTLEPMYDTASGSHVLDTGDAASSLGGSYYTDCLFADCASSSLPPDDTDPSFFGCCTVTQPSSRTYSCSAFAPTVRRFEETFDYSFKPTAANVDRRLEATMWRVISTRKIQQVMISNMGSGSTGLPWGDTEPIVLEVSDLGFSYQLPWGALTFTAAAQPAVFPFQYLTTHMFSKLSTLTTALFNPTSTNQWTFPGKTYVVGSVSSKTWNFEHPETMVDWVIWHADSSFVNSPRPFGGSKATGVFGSASGTCSSCLGDVQIDRNPSDVDSALKANFLRFYPVSTYNPTGLKCSQSRDPITTPSVLSVYNTRILGGMANFEAGGLDNTAPGLYAATPAKSANMGALGWVLPASYPVGNVVRIKDVSQSTSMLNTVYLTITAGTAVTFHTDEVCARADISSYNITGCYGLGCEAGAQFTLTLSSPCGAGEVFFSVINLYGACAQIPGFNPPTALVSIASTTVDATIMSSCPVIDLNVTISSGTTVSSWFRVRGNLSPIIPAPPIVPGGGGVHDSDKCWGWPEMLCWLRSSPLVVRGIVSWVLNILIAIALLFIILKLFGCCCHKITSKKAD